MSSHNKKYRKKMNNMHNMHNTLNTEQLAEKWFNERRKKTSPPPSPIIQGIRPYTVKLCEMCNNCNTSKGTNCCNKSICLDCDIFQSETFNRCSFCKTVINMDKYDTYDGLILTIPSYEEFVL
jgi:hypothetical protein